MCSAVRARKPIAAYKDWIVTHKMHRASLAPCALEVPHMLGVLQGLKVQQLQQAIA
jgi:hypothetical protein